MVGRSEAAHNELYNRIIENDSSNLPKTLYTNIWSNTTMPENRSSCSCRIISPWQETAIVHRDLKITSVRDEIVRFVIRTRTDPAEWPVLVQKTSTVWKLQTKYYNSPPPPPPPPSGTSRFRLLLVWSCTAI